MRFRGLLVATVLFFGTGAHVLGEGQMFETFENGSEKRWRFFADTVMGGVSQGQLEIVRDETGSYARMTGEVSTANNGGFIQFRRSLDKALPPETSEVRLLVRGNDQRYFVHVRTSGTVLPWQYYQAAFEASGEWTEIVVPLSAFKASGRLLRSAPKPQSIKSIGIVAFGRDHKAKIDVKEVSFR